MCPEPLKSLSPLVEIWVAPVDTRLRPDDWLDGDERAHFERLRLAADRGRFLASRVLLRCARSRCAPVPTRAWRFARLATGAWRILAPAETTLRFSIAHTDGVAVVAVRRGAAVGVDVESLDRPLPPEALAAVLTAAEKTALSALPSADRGRALVTLWTAKEAYAKFIGLGAAVDFTQVEVTLSPLRVRALTPQIPRDSAPTSPEPVDVEARHFVVGTAVHLVTFAAFHSADSPLQTSWRTLESPCF